MSVSGDPGRPAERRPIERLRSLLFVPAVRPDFIEKLPSRGADGVVIDCEDAVPAGAKAEARDHARTLAPKIAPEMSKQRGLVFVRVNAEPTAWFEDDLREALSGALSGLVLPKVERPAQLDRLAGALADLRLGHLRVIAGLETALGVAEARALLAHSRVDAAYFGAEDFTADMGGQRTEGGQEVLYARSQVALAGRLAGVPTLDQVVVDFRSASRFEAETREARALGYQGKLCIHPDQVRWANAGFVPSQDEVAHASRLLEAYEAASAKGLAAIDFEGQMVDEPLAARARQTLAAAAGAEPAKEKQP